MTHLVKGQVNARESPLTAMPTAASRATGWLCVHASPFHLFTFHASHPSPLHLSPFTLFSAALLAAADRRSRRYAALPTYDQVRQAHISTEGVLLDRHGEVLHELRVDMKGRRLDWVPLSDVSPALLRTLIRAEDKRFYEHSGVDWLALGDAALDTVFSSKPRGASTLSMQVAAMLEASLKPRKDHRTVGQKWDQIQAARDLEKKWTKPADPGSVSESVHVPWRSAGRERSVARAVRCPAERTRRAAIADSRRALART